MIKVSRNSNVYALVHEGWNTEAKAGDFVANFRTMEQWKLKGQNEQEPTLIDIEDHQGNQKTTMTTDTSLKWQRIS